MSRFTFPEYALEADVMTVPHVGRVSKERLAASGITSTYQLIGHYLKLKRDRAAFEAFLAKAGVAEVGGHAKAAAAAIHERVTNVGVKLHVRVPAEIIQSSRMTDDKAKDFVKRSFTGDLATDFKGVGMGPASVDAFKKAGITNSDQLFGEMLSKFDAAPTEDMMTSFYKRLGEIGMASGYKATMCEVLKMKLDIGIDQVAAPAMGGLSGVKEESDELAATGTPPRKTPYPVPEPTTGEGTRRRARVPEAAKPAAAAKSTVAAKADENGASFTTVAIGLLVLGAVCYMYGGSAGATPAKLPGAGEWI